MASENEVDPLLCDECKALPPVDGLTQWPGMCGRCGAELAPVVEMPAREAAFAGWLNAALLAAIPDDGTPITRDDATGGRVFDRAGCTSAITTGDCYRALLRLSNAGVIEWCGDDMKSIRRRLKRDAPPGGEDAIEQARRGPVPAVALCMTPEQAAVIREAEAFCDSVKPGALPSIANLCQAVATMRGGAS